MLDGEQVAALEVAGEGGGGQVYCFVVGEGWGLGFGWEEEGVGWLGGFSCCYYVYYWLLLYLSFCAVS